MAIDQRDSLDLNLNELLNFKVQALASDPTGSAARMYYSTSTNTLRWHNGTAWADLSSGATYNDESAQDAIAAAFANGTNTVVTVTYVDASNSFSLTIGTNQVTAAMQAQMPANTFKGNNTGVAANEIDLTVAQTKTALGLTGTNSGDQTITLTGNVTGTGTGSFATTIAANVITTGMLAAGVRLDTINAPTASVNANSQKIIALLDGTATTDAINLGQLNAAVEGRQWKDPVATTTTAALPNTPTYSAGAGTLTAGANAALAAQAGYTLVVGERLLVQNQASTFQNGIYSVTAVGSGAAAWVLTRTADVNTAAELSNATVMIEGSTSTLRGKVYTQQNTLADLTAAAQNYTATGDNNVYTADGTTLTLSAGQFAVTSGGISNTQINAGAAIAYSKLALATSLVAADVNPAAATHIARTFAGATAGGAVSEVITHNLNTRDVQVQCYNQNTPWQQVVFTIEATSVNTITLRSGANITAGIRVVVMG